VPRDRTGAPVPAMNGTLPSAFCNALDLPVTAPATSVKKEIEETAGTGSHPIDPHVGALGSVRQITLPSAARTLSTLSHVGYEDAFLVETGPAQDRAGEQWARAILEGAPTSTRNTLSRDGLRSAGGL
jgi:hypothetical protein